MSLPPSVSSRSSAGGGAQSPERVPTPAARPLSVAPAAGPELAAPLQYLRGVGPKAATALAARGLHTVLDLLRFLPRRYQPRSGVQNLADLADGVAVAVEADVHGVSQRNMRGRRSLEVVLSDGKGAVHLTWFRIPGGKAFIEQFRRGVRVRASGVVKHYRGRLQIVHPTTHIVSDDPVDPEGAGDAPDDAIVPLYLDVEGLHPNQLRRIIAAVLPAAWQVLDSLPEALRRVRKLVPLGEAYANLHAPPATTPVEALIDMQTPWQQRLIYDELLLLQLSVLRGKAATQTEAGHAFALREPLAAGAGRLLPFTLTAAQGRVLGEIEADLRKAVPMQRLLQGDVGSGKTAVALSAAAAAAALGLQSAIMAPTELLAEQHARTALKILEPAGYRVALLTGGLGAAERRGVLKELRAGTIQVVVGTHALIQEDIAFARLALGIIDEQHRFGVLQRARLKELGQASLGATPHMLVMTATPIPRTLALTVYGDLDVSVIDALPPGRSPIRTRLARDGQRDKVYAAVRQAVEEGRQAYVVFPLVEESDKEGMDKLRDATNALEELQHGPLHGLRLGLLHGRLTSDEKDAVMRAFAARELDVLVATTVIEVGIDVPNATVMVIENAERFGLSQLHQLRGRVGRGAHASACYLLSTNFVSEDAWRRLGVMEQTTDGFRIAEEDLAIRGPGDFVGTRQAGMPMLSLANLARDQAVLAMAREDAQGILGADPHLAHADHAALAGALAGDARLGLARVG